MFGNFIYFIVVVLIYSTYQPSEETNLSGTDTLGFFLFFLFLFVTFTKAQFRRIEKRLLSFGAGNVENEFHSLVTRQSIMAVALFALNVYGLSLPDFFTELSLFEALPTAQALLFLGLFIVYMTVVWNYAYPSQRRIYGTDMSRASYVLSNISFVLPVLMPWLVLSGVSDIIQVLPFEWPKEFLATTTGEIAYFLTFLLMVAVLGPAMIQKFWRCKPLEMGPHRARIENLCRRADVEYNNILHWPIFGGKMITAGVMGLVARFRYILVTDALLSYLNPDEIEAVIAHEIGHVKRKHLLFYLFFFVGYMVLSYAVFDLIVLLILYIQPVFKLIGRAGFNPATFISGAFSLAIIAMFLVYFRFIFGYFMRNFERQADVYVYRLFHTAGPLISTLQKIAVTSGQPPDRPNWHHFSIQERIDYLNKCESDATWIGRQDQKIKKSIGIFIVAMAVMGGIGYQLNFGETGKRLNRHFLETVIVRELESHPNDPRLLATLGDLLYDRKNYTGALTSWEQALHVNPQNPHVLNNLAWLYATCENQDLRDHRRALYLAQKAILLETTSPHIWDTLAESYFVNGMYKEAVEAERKALGMVTSGREYYEKQLKRFEEARAKKRQSDQPMRTI